MKLAASGFLRDCVLILGLAAVAVLLSPTAEAGWRRVPPSTPTSFKVTNAQATSLSVNWSPGSGALPTGYGLYRGSAQTGSTSATAYTYSGLSCGTSYTLAVDAVNAFGRSAKATISASTSPCPPLLDTQPPTAPAGVAKTSSTQSSISVSWSASSDNVGVTGYGEYRGGSSVGSASSTSYTFTGLSCGTSYTLAVDAVDAAGNRSAKSSLSASTAACSTPDTEPPSQPDNMAKSGSTGTSVTLSWTAASDNVGVAGYYLYRDGVKAGSTAQLSYTYTGLACGTSYTLVLTAFDAAGNETDGRFATSVESTDACAPAPGDTQAPTLPGNLLVTGSSGTSLSLSWSASIDNVGVSGYGLYRNGASVASTAATGYSFGGLACGTSYTFAVDAVDAAGNRSGRSAITASTAACAPADTQAPTVPGNLLVTGSTATSLSLSWSASIDNVGVSGYGLYRDGSSVGSTGSTGYSFGGLVCGTSYTLAVDAGDAAGNRSSKATVSATTAACASPPPPGSATAFVASSGSDANPCTQAAPCASFDRAYRVAKPGDVVQVAAGTYPQQVIGLDSSKTSSSDVVFQPAAGATVTVNCQSNGANCISVVGSHITVKDFHTATLAPNAGLARQGGVGVQRGASDVTLQNLDAGYFWTGGTNVNVLGGDYGPSSIDQSTIGDGSNVLVDGVYIHDARYDGVTHIVGLYINTGHDVTIQDSRFENNSVSEIAVYAGEQDANINHYVIQNNTFVNTNSSVTGNGINLSDHGGTISNWVIRNNSFSGVSLISGVSGTNNVFYGNILNDQSSCDTTAGTTWDYNLAPSGKKCGTHDVIGTVNFVDPSHGNLHIQATSAGVNAANPANYPATDIDGRTRPLGGAPDAGANEAG